MSYSLYALKRNPQSLWLLDDTAPYADYTGFGAVADTDSGSLAATTHPALVAGANHASVVSGVKIIQFESPVFKTGQEARPFVLEAWILPIQKTTTSEQKILSHDTTFDGLTINGNVIKFSTEYTTEDPAECSYDIQTPRAVHVAGVHTADRNMLYIDGELVDTFIITDAQKEDSFIANDGYLYSGETTSEQELAINGVALYSITPPDTFTRNFEAGRKVVPQDDISPIHNGQQFDLSIASGSTFIDLEYADKADFLSGAINSVAIGDDAIYPSYSSGVSVAGTWTCAVPLDFTGATSIYGVMVEWSAIGVTVEASLDGSSWSTINNGELVGVITNGYNPTGKDLQVRFSFAGGLAEDPATIEYVRIVGYLNNTVDNPHLRAVTVGHPGVVRDNYEPIEYRNNNGVRLVSSTLTIGADTDTDPSVVRTLEAWIKPISGTPTISVTGTKYRNGSVDTSLPVGEWSLIHYISAGDITGSVTINGNCIVGQVVLYDTALTANQIADINASYTGIPVIVADDTDETVQISEPASPTATYAHDWAIFGAG